MSEADTSNNQPLPEPTASIDDSAAEVQSANKTSENRQNISLSKLSELKDMVQQTRQEVTIESVKETTVSSTNLEEDESSSETPDVSGQGRTNEADWFALAQKMRQRNRHLIEQVTDLRQALREKEETLRIEQMRSRDRETTLAQKTEELDTLQEQLARLFHALESSHQAAQRQQILIETLSEQLQSSQERLAQLERECTLTQQRYNEQSHQLLQAANTCRELRTRLQRQQQQTLQFKAALEKSLEMSNSSNLTEQQQRRQRGGKATPSFGNKAHPIQPWSAEPELQKNQQTSNFDTIWKLPILVDPPSAAYSSESLGFEIKRAKETDVPSMADANDPTETPIGRSAPVEPFAKWDEVVSKEQTPFASSQESADTELELEEQLLAEMTSLAEASGLSEFQSDVAEVQALLTPELGSKSDESDEAGSYISYAEETPSPEDTAELDSEVQTPSDDLWEDAVNRDPDEPEVVLPQSNWPSPTLYPLRSPKKRKSLAAIDLPNFPRFRPT